MDPEPKTRLKPSTVPAAMQVAQRRRGDTEITHHCAPGSVDLVLSAVFVENLAGKPVLQVPSSRAAAPRPPGTTAIGRPQDDTDSSRASLPELPRTQRPSLPDLSRPNPTSSTGMKHSSSAPPPPPPGRRANAPPTPLPMHSNKAVAYNREKPLPPTPGQRLHPGREGPSAPPPVKPPPSPVNVRSGPSGQSLAPPPPPYRQPPGVPNGPSSPTNESAPELPQRHNSLHRKTPGPARGLAPPPPTSASPSSQSNRPPPPTRDPPSRGAGKCLEVPCVSPHIQTESLFLFTLLTKALLQ